MIRGRVEKQEELMVGKTVVGVSVIFDATYRV